MYVSSEFLFFMGFSSLMGAGFLYFLMVRVLRQFHRPSKEMEEYLELAAQEVRKLEDFILSGGVMQEDDLPLIVNRESSSFGEDGDSLSIPGFKVEFSRPVSYDNKRYVRVRVRRVADEFKDVNTVFFAEQSPYITEIPAIQVDAPEVIDYKNK